MFPELDHAIAPTAPLAATVARLLPAARALGVTRLANLTGLDRIGLPVWSAVRPDALTLASAMGKGLSDDAARAGALMESIEIWHAEHFAGPLLFDAPAAVRRGSTVLALELLARRRAIALDWQQPMLLTAAHDLASGAPCWLPWEVVSMDLRSASVLRSTFIRSTDGLAGAMCRQHALLHALCELVERDAVWHWRQHDRASPARRVEPATAGPVLAGIAARIAPHAALALWDITPSHGIACYACVLVDLPGVPDAALIGCCAGYACRPDAQGAAIAAVLEAVQARAALIAGARDDLDEAEYAACRAPALVAALQGEIGEAGDRQALRADFEGGPAPLRSLLNALHAYGCQQIAAVDLSRPEVGLPVIKLVAPQLRCGVFNSYTAQRQQHGGADRQDHAQRERQHV
ncbi:YcaO-like family protein [Massilia sp. DWR3-1-1]|uniref:YcaO-like family protein n=1 Tax=Massilia sp. DWR3-1-1 TaxID=2804559 RepID=UPI003CF0318C